MLINLLWDEPKAGSFTIITTSNITLQDIEKNKSLTATARTAEFRGLKLPVLKGGASR